MRNAHRMELAELYDWPAPTTQWDGDPENIYFHYTNKTTPGTWSVFKESRDTGEKVKQASFKMFGFGPAKHHGARERFKVKPVGHGDFTAHPPFGNAFDLESVNTDSVADPDWGAHQDRYNTHIASNLPKSLTDGEYDTEHELDGGLDIILTARKSGIKHYMNVDLMHPSLEEPLVLGQAVTAPTSKGHADGCYRPVETENPGMVVSIPGVGPQGFEYLPEFTRSLKTRFD